MKNPCPWGNCTFPSEVHNQGLGSMRSEAKCLPGSDDGLSVRSCFYPMTCKKHQQAALWKSSISTHPFPAWIVSWSWDKELSCQSVKSWIFSQSGSIVVVLHCKYRFINVRWYLLGCWSAGILLSSTTVYNGPNYLRTCHTTITCYSEHHLASVIAVCLHHLLILYPSKVTRGGWRVHLCI